MTTSRQSENSHDKTPEVSTAVQDKTSSTKIFEDLAKSRSLFHNIGLIRTEKKLSKEITILREGSGIYIGNQIAITAAHILPDEVQSGNFLSDTGSQTHFYVEGNDGVSQKARVIMAYRHPDYIINSITFRFNIFKLLNLKNDIAILFLDRELTNLDPLQLNYSPQDIENNATAVGFSRYMTPIPHEYKRTTRDTGEIKNVGVRVHEMYYDKNLELYVNKIGYSIKSKDWFGKKMQINPFDPLDAGTYPGMSGGGYFDKNSVFALVCGGWKTPYYEHRTIKDDDTHILSDEDFSVPFFKHKTWIEKIIALYKTQLPSLMDKNAQWKKNICENKKHAEEPNNTSVLTQSLSLTSSA